MLSMGETCKRQSKGGDSSCLNNLNSDRSPGRFVLSVSIKELSVLYSSYMPFLINGGIFIPAAETYELSDEVFLLLSLVNDEDQIPVNAKVVWVTPKHAQVNRACGIGLQFLEKNSAAKNKIEHYLGTMQSSKQLRFTL